MPYTPPNRSPASSAPTSPEGSRRPSLHQLQTQSASSRPVLPRSASYMTRQRRTPSATTTAQSPANEPSRNATSDDLKSLLAGRSVRQSPPPITSERGMPSAAIISPPESSSEDESPPEDRGRQIENLKELHDAVSQIPQQEPTLANPAGEAGEEAPDAGDLLVLPAQARTIAQGIHHSFSTGSLDELATSGGRRRISHTRSATEPHIPVSKSAGGSVTGSEEDSDEERQCKPQMVRKKSGELVRPALRAPSRKRPSSMPGTPTFSKAVHFDSHLEHVRHFLQVDKPLAVSAGSSPIDNYESDSEYPFSGDERSARGSPRFEWEIVVNNFPLETPARKAQPVRLERVWLSGDQKCLVGSVAVGNFAFQKTVACRFTLDYWKITSEVLADYVCEVRPVETPYGQDRFHFAIKLADLVNLESKTLYFCVRYNVNGQEYWDNNNGMNFQVDFRKKILPGNDKKSATNASSRTPRDLPKSNRRSSPSASPKDKPRHTASDEFGDHPRVSFNRSIHDYLGESGPRGLRLKGVRSCSDVPGDNLSSGLTAPSGQFSQRYDFSDSLTRAIQNAKDRMISSSDGLYMKSRKKPDPASRLITGSEEKTERPPVVKASPTIAGPPAASPADSPKTDISSASYEEIVNKWCFFGSKPKNAQSGNLSSTTGRSADVDDGSRGTSDSNKASHEGSPVQMGNYHYTHSGTQHHTLHSMEPNPYSHGALALSPVESPLHTLSPPRTASSMSSPSQTPAGPGQALGHSPEPHSIAGNFAPFTGTSPNEYPYQRAHDRFPFSRTEAYAAAAIRG